jgi:hypothetical protein
MDPRLASLLVLVLYSSHGVIQLILLAQTKSCQAAAANVIVAHTSASGLSPGNWLRRLQALLSPDKQGPEDRSSRRSRMDFPFFLYTFLYPLLGLMQLLGNAYLSKYDESPGKELQKVFHGFNTLQQTGGSVTSKKALRRTATPPLWKLWNTVAGV